MTNNNISKIETHAEQYRVCSSPEVQLNSLDIAFVIEASTNMKV